MKTTANVNLDKEIMEWLHATRRDFNLSAEVRKHLHELMEREADGEKAKV